jgi:hypothetical protein
MISTRLKAAAMPSDRVRTPAVYPLMPDEKL